MKKKRTIWMTNTAGKSDAVLTMAFVGFLVVIFKVLLSGMKLPFFGAEIAFGTIDPAMIGAILTPTLGCYVARRYTDAKITSTVTSTKEDK